MQAERAVLWQNSTSAVVFASVALLPKQGGIFAPCFDCRHLHRQHLLSCTKWCLKIILIVSSSSFQPPSFLRQNKVWPLILSWTAPSEAPHIPSPGQRAVRGPPLSFHAPSPALLNPSVHLPTYVRRQLQAGHERPSRGELVHGGR